MKRLLAFDLDGTLAPSKSPCPDRVSSLLDELLNSFQICVISGGKFEQFENQLLANLQCDGSLLGGLHIMPTCGTQYYGFNVKTNRWGKVYSEDFTKDEKDQIILVLNETIKKLGLDKQKTYGPQIEDRGSQISWSSLGQDVVDVLGEEGVKLKEDWDPDNAKKTKIRDLIAPRLINFEVRSGGLTTIDITKPGIDKAYGMKKLITRLGIKKTDILFFGDRLQEGGNDFPVKAMGIECIEVGRWQDTALALETILHLI